MDIIQFNMPKEQPAIIKVIGVGGGGCNAVNHMYNQGIVGVSFVICNTDLQVLNASPVPNQVQLGPDSTQGRGAGANPERGKQATNESLEEIRGQIGEDTQMLFITCGMGGGTGTGGGPMVAKLAREMGILSVGIVTTPFSFEGGMRDENARRGIEEMRQYVDTLIVISNDKVLEMYSESPITEAFKNADGVLVTAAKSIAEIITVTGIVNVDFADVEAVMRDSGVAIMGAAIASGDDRAKRAVMEALASPLLNDNKITGAKHVLINIRFGAKEALAKELEDISTYVQQEAGNNPNVILGVCKDDALEDEISITVLATGFNRNQPLGMASGSTSRTVINIGEDWGEESVEESKTIVQAPITQVQSPVVEAAPEITEIPLVNDAPAPVIEEPKSVIVEKSEIIQKSEIKEISLYSEPEEVIEKNTDLVKEDNIQFNEVEREEIDTEISDQDDMKFKEFLRRRKERLSKLSGHINELEREPAFKRRKDLQLDTLPDNRKEQLSNVTLEIDDDGGQLRFKKDEGNSYLHNNPD